METVEKQAEDVPLNLGCPVDDQGNKYEFASGLNWKGAINDQ